MLLANVIHKIQVHFQLAGSFILKYDRDEVKANDHILATPGWIRIAGLEKILRMLNEQNVAHSYL